MYTMGYLYDVKLYCLHFSGLKSVGCDSVNGVVNVGS